MECILWTDASGTSCAYYQATSTPLVVQDAGNVTLGLTFIIAMMAMMMFAFLFNSSGGHRR